jgi:glucosamine--fructose-6-phosphate aminotransferase (isomerizing)
LYKEIHEQPEVLARFLGEENERVRRLADEIERRQITYVAIAARGTSDNAARYANYLFGSVNRLPVALATPSLYSIYKKPPRFGNALVIGISQSGKSPDIIAVLDEAHRQGVLTATITNFPNSDLGKVADHIISLHAGQEQSVAATKTYTCELAAIALLSTLLANDQQMFRDLMLIPEHIRKTLFIGKEIEKIAHRYCYMRACVVIGRGYNYATAYEMALKLKELTYTVVESYSSADFMHGPLAMIEQGFPVIVIAPTGAMLPEIKNLIATLKQHQAEVIVISDDPGTLSQARIPLALPVTVPEWLSPLICIVPGQLLALHLAVARDHDPDHPRALRKVTETR